MLFIHYNVNYIYSYSLAIVNEIALSKQVQTKAKETKLACLLNI